MTVEIKNIIESYCCCSAASLAAAKDWLDHVPPPHLEVLSEEGATGLFLTLRKMTSMNAPALQLSRPEHPRFDSSATVHACEATFPPSPNHPPRPAFTQGMAQVKDIERAPWGGWQVFKGEMIDNDGSTGELPACRG